MDPPWAWTCWWVPAAVQVLPGTWEWLARGLDRRRGGNEGSTIWMDEKTNVGRVRRGRRERSILKKEELSKMKQIQKLEVQDSGSSWINTLLRHNSHPMNLASFSLIAWRLSRMWN